ncbi:MAG: hypothetical protein ACREEP_05645 [Dongiaceae bacterium]
MSFFDPLNGSGLLLLQGFAISEGTLVEEFLQGMPIVKTAPQFCYQFVRDVNGKAAPFDASIKDMTGVLFTRSTGFTVLAHTGASPQAQRAERGGPEKGGLFSEPLLDIGEGVSFRGHGACVPYNTHTCQVEK